LRLSRVLRWRM